MKRLRYGFLAVATGLLISGATAGSALAAHEAYDGQTLEGQSAATQTLFQRTWGDQASMRWTMEHNAELVARGLAPADIMNGSQMESGQSGAQTGNLTQDRTNAIQSDESNPSRDQGGDDDDDDEE